MQFAHILFLSLYSLQAAGSYINVDVQHEIAKRGHKSSGTTHKGSPSESSHESSASGSSESSGSSSGSSGSSNSNSSSSKGDTDSKPSGSKENPTTTDPVNAAAVTTPVEPKHSTTVRSESETKTASSSSETATIKNTGKAKGFMKEFGTTVKDLAIEAVGGIIVEVAIKEIVNANSGSGSSSSATLSMQAVQFVTTNSAGSAETTVITAAPSAFSTGSDGKAYIKTDATSAIVNAESTMYDASATSLI